MVASFTVHGADETQAVVTAAEANRAPAIIAVDIPATAFANCDVCITIAESIAARATVPVGIEVVSRPALQQQRLPRSSAPGMAATRNGCGNVAEKDVIPGDLEVWLPVTDLPESLEAIDRIGVTLHDGGSKAPSSGALRKQVKSIRNRFDGPLVVDGDAAWSNGTFHGLPKMGVCKINFDRRLRQIMADANRRVVKKAGDDFRRAMEHVSAALVAEVTTCLRRTGCTGRAADVAACAASNTREDSRDTHDSDVTPRFAERYIPTEFVRAGTHLQNTPTPGNVSRLSFAH
jgi:hypothetical protein